jgi:hypothetical protein
VRQANNLGEGLNQSPGRKVKQCDQCGRGDNIYLGGVTHRVVHAISHARCEGSKKIREPHVL